MHVDRRLLGWGAFFILVGVIPLAVRANLLDPQIVGRWLSLWPLLLIGWGLGLILRKTPIEWIGGAVAAITFGVMGGGALATGFDGFSACGGDGGDPAGAPFATQRATFAGSGQLNVAFNCGTLTMNTVDGTEWSVSGTETEGRAPTVESSGTTVSIESPGGGSFFDDIDRARWTVAVPRTPQVGLGITLNAGNGSADLTGATIPSVNLTVNAGSFRLDLEGASFVGDVNATVNAGSTTIGLPGGGRSVNLSLNAGDLDVCLPAGTPVRVRWAGTLGSNDLDDAGLTKIDDDTWVSAGFDESVAHVELHVSANAGSFGFDLGGSGCSV